MTQEQANKIITEAMGKCWHEPSIDLLYCRRCKEYFGLPNGTRREITTPDFFTSSGFFECWNWAKGEKWWEVFCKVQSESIGYIDLPMDSGLFPMEYINPSIFPMKLAEFIKEENR